MSVNYRASAQRHYKDAEFLHESKRMPNADQLYGLAAECALKAVMVGLGAGTSPVGDLADRQHRVHIDALWAEFRAFADGRKGARYLNKLSVDNPFSDWRIEYRYADDNHVPPKAIFAHRTGAYEALVALERALADGKIS
jgi:hypothetical protein